MSRPANQMGFTRVLLYQLKRQYGATADVYRETDDGVDLETGRRSVTRQVWRIRRAICLPTATSAQQLLPPAIVAIWRQGGGAEVGDKQIVIDRRDLPRGFRLRTHNDSVVVDRRRYEVLKVEEFEFEAAYLVTLKELAGARVCEQVEARVRDDVVAGGGVDGGP